ncbi:hypothetical protein B0H14DRAFT_2611461 [Mycena olivaceomarginata]|nr:hypothetical protein B0H14DRAFT_2611461 [Mycena olivaceomarginata]
MYVNGWKGYQKSKNFGERGVAHGFGTACCTEWRMDAPTSSRWRCCIYGLVRVQTGWHAVLVSPTKFVPLQRRRSQSEWKWKPIEAFLPISIDCYDKWDTDIENLCGGTVVVVGLLQACRRGGQQDKCSGPKRGSTCKSVREKVTSVIHIGHLNDGLCEEDNLAGPRRLSHCVQIPRKFFTEQAEFKQYECWLQDGLCGRQKEHGAGDCNEISVAWDFGAGE